MSEPYDSDDPGIIDLLGVLAYGELSAFDRLAEDARTAPTLQGRAALAAMAAAEIGHYRLLEQHLAGVGVDVFDAMAPFIAMSFLLGGIDFVTQLGPLDLLLDNTGYFLPGTGAVVVGRM